MDNQATNTNSEISTSENLNTSKDDKAKDYLKKFIHFFKRTDYNVNQNLRFASVVLAIILLFGMFQPLIGITFGVDIKASGQDTTQSKTFSIIPENTKYLDLNIGDLVVRQSLRDFEIFDTPIGDISILGINLYDFATSSFPDFSGIENVNNALDAEWLRFLESEQFEKICHNFLGEYADGVIDVASTIVGLSEKTGDVLDKVIDVLNTLSEAKGNLVEGVHAAESLVSTVETVVFLIVALFIAGVVLLFFKKLPRYLAAGVMTPVCIIFIAIGIGFLVVNGMLDSIIDPVDQSFNQVLQDFLANSLPDVSKILEGVLNSVNVDFVLNFKIVAGLGWWIMTLCITGCTVMGYVIGRRNKGLVGDARK